MKRVFKVIFVLCVALWVSNIRSTMAVEFPPDPPIPDHAQSTTGPKPPSGIYLNSGLTPSPSAVTIADVPAYDWHHGCGPTAAGMVLGYWDGQGFEALVAGDASTQTEAVDQMIASEGPTSNYTDYCLPMDSGEPDPLPDKSELPIGDEHPDDSIADYMKTSQSAHRNYYGWSWSNHVGPAMKSYAESVNTTYEVTVGNLWAQEWDEYRAEIDAGRPVVLLVDTNGDGGTDHFVTAIGYDDGDSVRKYACLDTWYSEVRWQEFAPMAQGQAWGIWGGTTFVLSKYDSFVYLPLVNR